MAAYGGQAADGLRAVRLGKVWRGFKFIIIKSFYEGGRLVFNCWKIQNLFFTKSKNVFKTLYQDKGNIFTGSGNSLGLGLFLESMLVIRELGGKDLSQIYFIFSIYI